LDKIKEHNSKQQIKAELGQEDKIEDYLEKDESGPMGQDVDTRQRTNFTLRTRDDIPDYLQNFNKKTDEKEIQNQKIREKYSGQKMNFLEQEKYAWDLIDNKKMNIVNSVAMPSLTEQLYKKTKHYIEKTQNEIKTGIEELYGKQPTLEDFKGIKGNNDEEDN